VPDEQVEDILELLGGMNQSACIIGEIKARSDNEPPQILV